HELHKAGACTSIARSAETPALESAPLPAVEGLSALRGRARGADRHSASHPSIFPAAAGLRLDLEAGRAARAAGLDRAPVRSRARSARPIVMKILGLSAHYHDSAAALVVDGLPVAAVQEERLSRRKNDAAFPLAAVEYCLDEAGL